MAGMGIGIGLVLAQKIPASGPADLPAGQFFLADEAGELLDDDDTPLTESDDIATI